MSHRPSISTSGGHGGQEPGTREDSRVFLWPLEHPDRPGKAPTFIISVFLDRQGRGWLGALTVKGAEPYSHAAPVPIGLRMFSQQDRNPEEPCHWDLCS